MSTSTKLQVTNPACERLQLTTPTPTVPTQPQRQPQLLPLPPKVILAACSVLRRHCTMQTQRNGKNTALAKPVPDDRPTNINGISSTRARTGEGTHEACCFELDHIHGGFKPVSSRRAIHYLTSSIETAHIKLIKANAVHRCPQLHQPCYNRCCDLLQPCISTICWASCLQ
jgi:hypothetical protein